ncbi:hypothetical protein [Chryseobacterium sp.]|uniref:hypothetical protein n=1 Tax=Chryseobacterium sp. TaxID=1871047 RepID=UPI00388E8196
MKYPQLTVFNYKILYYTIRIFGLYWLYVQYTKFLAYQGRPKALYEPVFDIQKFLFPEFPSQALFLGMLLSCGFLFLVTFWKQSYILNGVLFLLTAIINLPISANYGLHHDNHVVILAFFLSIFLLPKNLEEKDYRYVQYFYLGLLATYSLAGMGKILGTVKNVVKQTDKLLWINSDAAKLNTYDNYYRADTLIPDWMQSLYLYENLWIVVTISGIAMQFLCFLGAFNRKLLTFFMVFLFTFHLYTMKFVLANFETTNLFILTVFFPYHIFSPQARTKNT